MACNRDTEKSVRGAGRTAGVPPAQGLAVAAAGIRPGGVAATARIAAMDALLARLGVSQPTGACAEVRQAVGTMLAHDPGQSLAACLEDAAQSATEDLEDLAALIGEAEERGAAASARLAEAYVTMRWPSDWGAVGEAYAAIAARIQREPDRPLGALVQAEVWRLENALQTLVDTGWAGEAA